MTRLTVLQQSLWLGMLTILLVAQAPPPGYAEEPSTQSNQAPIPELELIKEEETVSIASRYEQPISQSPSNVYVITDEDIRQSGAPDLPTILRRVPGLEVMQTTGADFNVSARGDNQLVANKMLVLVDGRSIYVDAQGSVYWKMIPVTLPEIKRIEVLKGPASSVYGFNALDGTINIITKSPEDMKGTTLQFGGGTYGTISSAAIHAGTVGKFGYRLSAGSDQTAQWQDRNALSFRANKFNLQTEYDISSLSKLKISGGLVDSNRFEGPTTELTTSQGTPAQGYAHVVYERPNVFIRGFWNHLTDVTDAVTNPILAPFFQSTDRTGNHFASSTADTYNIEAQHSVEIGPRHRLTYGTNYRHNTLSTNIISQFSREDRLGFYAQGEWLLAQPLTLITGARYDLNTFINPTISPRVALVYQIVPEHTLRASLSVAYRPPTLYETNLDARSQITAGPLTSTTIVTPSHNLSSEEMVSYELGYQGWYLNHRLRVRADLFFNHLTNLINFRGTTPGFAGAVNDPGQADIYGGEAGIEFLATSWLSGFVNYSYEEIGQSFTDTARRGFPRSKVNAGVRGEWDNGLSGEVVYHYVGEATYPIAGSFTAFSPLFPPGVTAPSTRVDSYNLLNLRTAYKFWQQKAEAGYMRDAEVAISAFNALNDEHKEQALGQTIGSRVMGWLTVRY
ncbi:MAG TPA: TonB-dependent receptor [Nitrospiraceae bacterium]|nr:TonB-dependent receptor [Nitrospiraceae bacterium]